MNYLFLITLYGINKIQGERSIYSLYHLFKGKRSSQTIQDAQLFQLDHLFGVIPDIERKKLELVGSGLCKSNDVVSIENNIYVITEQGKNTLANFQFPDSLNGWKYANSSDVFWERISLTIQSISYVIRYETRFIPINRNPKTLIWVKNFLTHRSLIRQEVAEALYGELLTALKLIDEKRASIFVHKLTSYHRVGNTNDQIAEFLNMETLQVKLLFLSTLHFLLLLIEERPEDFPLLVEIAQIKENQITLTFSTQRTYELLHAGFSIEEIATSRSLKKNTIEDHIVEIALVDSQFDISQFVHDELYRSIKDCIEQEKTNQLRQIKKSLQVPASYFEIRLVLAKVGGAYGTRENSIK